MLNVLAMAHQVIPYQKIKFFKWTGTEQNTNLLDSNDYAKGVTAKVKINAKQTPLMKKMGLDYKKTYVRLFSIPKISGLSRINNGDQFEFDDKRWQVEFQTGWYATAGWDSFVCVDVTITQGVN